MEHPMDVKICLGCGAPFSMEAKYCSGCGRALAPGAPPAEPAKPKWYHSVWFVLLMISPVTLGPFGLPLLWKSPAFSRPVKIGLTLFTLLLTALLVVYIVKVVVPAVMNEMTQLNSTFQF